MGEWRVLLHIGIRKTRITRTIRIRNAPIGPDLNVPPSQSKGFGRFRHHVAGLNAGSDLALLRRGHFNRTVCFHVQIQIIH